MKNHTFNRRKFLKSSLVATACASPLMAMMDSLNKVEAAETGGGYKAIVCVLLEGGCDGFNMIAPTQNSSYADYKVVRQAIALNQEELLPFVHANANEVNPLAYGMRGNMSGMHELFEAEKLAVIANVGTLISPVTLEDVLNDAPLPRQLFAHNTQRSLWMMGNAANAENRGWGGRMGDVFYPTPNPYFNITTGGNNIMQSGGIAEAIAFRNASVSPNTMESYGFGPDAGDGELGTVYQAIYQNAQSAEHKLLSTFAKRRVDKLIQQVSLQNLFDGVQTFEGFSSGVHETGKPLGKQLELVAQILSVKNNFPVQTNRQVFFVNHRGWDTHAGDNEQQVGYLSESLATFYAALESMGIEDQVTTFTMSDFGRSLSPNGAGTDHGWGGHAFVMGGAVRGGDIYGQMPAMTPNSPDAWSDRMIPTTSIEEYLATIVKWFGATDIEMDTIFPNLGSFVHRDMGFLPG